MDGLFLLMFILISYAAVFAKEKVGWFLILFASTLLLVPFRGSLLPYRWQAIGGYAVLLALLRLYASNQARGQRFNNWLTARLDKLFVFFSGVSLTQRVIKLKEWGERKKAEEQKKVP